MRVVGRYELVREIGRGGAGVVYAARQIDLDRLVALKELNALRAADPSAPQRFLREARVAGSLTHPNIVTVHEYFEEDGIPYIAMEYLPRGSLRAFMAALTPARIGGVLQDALAGLAHAERLGVVHRDIKPENLLVADDGGVKITDFGIAKARDSVGRGTLTADGLTVGTPNYMAPEQAMARQVGPWTDLYALGVTTFEMLVGHTPFADTPEPMAVALRQVNDPIPRVSDVKPDVPAVLSDWVTWLVAKDPAARPQSAAHAWAALEEALISLLGPRWRRGSDGPLHDALLVSPAVTAAATVPPRRPPASSPPRPKSRRKGALALVGIVPLLVALAAFALRPGGGPQAPVQQQAPTGQTENAPPVGAATTSTTTPAVVVSQQPAAPVGSGASPARTVPTPAASPRTSTVSQTAPPASSQAAPPSRSQPPAAPAKTTRPTPQQPTPQQPTQSSGGSCAGDSSSDDPSDDDCSQEP
jgi:serine/threonine protein kinase